MDSSHAFTNSGLVDSRTAIPTTLRSFSRSLYARGQKSESPEAMTKVSMCSRRYASSSASMTSRMSAPFFPARVDGGTSMSSTPRSWRRCVAPEKRVQSAYERRNTTLPFSRSVSSAGCRSKVSGAMPVRVTRFSKSMNSAMRWSCGSRFMGLRRALGAVQEDRQPALVRVDGAQALGVVHGRDVHLARPELRVGDGHQVVAPVHERGHEAALPLQDGVERHRTVGGRDELVDEIRVAGAEVVRQVGDDRLLAGAPLDLVGERL